MKRARWSVVVAFVALVGGLAAVYAWPDPVADARDDLRAAVADQNNHQPYAELVRAELAAVGKLKTATFEMPCFWAGEAHFGGLPGVYRTTPGMLGASEVVRVEYDPAVTSPFDLLAILPDPSLSGRGCVYDPTTTHLKNSGAAFTPDDLPKWSIRQSDALQFVPMTPAQAARVNADFHASLPVEKWLSPAQNRLLDRIRKHPQANWSEYVGDERLWTLLQKSCATR